MTNDSRKEFEAWHEQWATPHGISEHLAPHWEIWQASRAGLEAELSQARAELAEAHKRLDHVVWGEEGD